LLATVFGGEEPPDRARHNLTEALSHIRRAFGAEAIAARVQDVQLSAECPITFDFRQFEAAIGAGDLERAAGLYAGPFLNGVFLERAPAFDDWVARERTRLSRRFVDVCRVVVPRLFAAGKAAAAVSLAELWLEEDPEDAEPAVGLLAAIAAPGTREALRATQERFRQLKGRLRAEFDSEPDDRVSAMAAQYEAVATSAATSTTPPIATPSPPAIASPTGASTATLHPPRRFNLAWVSALVLALAAGTWAMFRANRAASTTRPWVLVADTQDPARDAILTSSLTMALRVALAQSTAIDVVTAERARVALRFMQRPDSAPLNETTAVEVAMRLGASHVVVPSLARLESQRALSARLLEVPSGRTIAVEQADAVAENDLLTALGDLAQRLLRRVGNNARAFTASEALPEVTTASLGALEQYARGQNYFARGRADSALYAYRRAVALDAQFAMAYAGTGLALHTLNLPAAGDSAFTAALALRGRLSAREAMRIEASRARWRRQSDTAIALLERWLASHPFDRDTRSALAYDLFRNGRNAEARDTYLQVLATDSLDARDWINLATATSALNTPADLALARKASARAFALAPNMRTEVGVNHAYGALLVRAGFADSAEAVFRDMLGEDPGRAARGYRSLGLLALWRERAPDAAAAFARGVQAHRDARESLGEVRARLLLVSALDDTGDTLAVRAELDTVRMLSRSGVAEPTVLYWAGKAMARHNMPGAAREMLDTLRRRAVEGNPRHESAALLLLGEIDVASNRAREAIPRMERGVALDSSVISRESLAHAARAAGYAARADSMDRIIAAAPWFGWEGTLVQQAASRRSLPKR